jgi:hypothetical protein
MSRLHVAFAALFAAGCSAEQQFVLADRTAADQVFVEHKIVIDGHTTMNYSYAREHWYQTLFPFLPILTAGGARHDVDVVVERVVKGSETRTALKIRNYRELTPDEIRMLPYPNDVMGIIGGEMRVRLGYDDRSGDRFSNLHIIAIENTPTMAAALRHAATLPASLPAKQTIRQDRAL